jgi:hypothetical protein
MWLSRIRGGEPPAVFSSVAAVSSEERGGQREAEESRDWHKESARNQYA